MASREAQVKEIIKCGQNPTYFIDNYIKIQHPMKGLIPFKTYDYQKRCVNDFQKHRLNIVLKSRQLGLSTIAAAYAVWLAIYHRDKNILIIATKLPTAINFIKKVKVALAGIPDWLKITKTVTETKSEISFDNGSQIKAIPRSEDAGRSEALSLLIIDEAAFISSFSEIWTGLQPTMSTGGSAIILSTPNGTVGVGQQYYNMWTEAEAGQNDFNAIRLEWWVHPEHDQIWFEKEARQLRDQKKISQELLCDFLTSGDTYLQPDDLTWLRMQITEPIKKENKNKIWIWKDPEPNKKYLISADVSRGDGKDYSAFHIFDYDDCEVVVEFMDKLPPDRLADLMIEWGKKYNDAVIVPENNSYGYLTCTRLRNENYKRLFYQSNKKDIFEILDPQPEELNGFSTQTKSRVQILSKLEEVIRNKLLTVHSRRLYEQLNTFIWNNGKAQASAESYDDLVLSAAIGVWLVSDVTALPVDDKEMLYAMLRASSLERNSQSTTLSKVNEVKPFVSPAIMGSNPNSVYHPRSSEFAQKQRPGAQGLFNFNWLLR
jgi:hypothetical protein